MAEHKDSKSSKLTELLKEERTINELVEATGLSKATIRTQVGYHLPKIKGLNIVKGNKNGQLSYRIASETEETQDTDTGNGDM